MCVDFNLLVFGESAKLRSANSATRWTGHILPPPHTHTHTLVVICRCMSEHFDFGMKYKSSSNTGGL